MVKLLMSVLESKMLIVIERTKFEAIVRNRKIIYKHFLKRKEDVHIHLVILLHIYLTKLVYMSFSSVDDRNEMLGYSDAHIFLAMLLGLSKIVAPPLSDSPKCTTFCVSDTQWSTFVDIFE